jgi:hypothetical protein
VWVQWMRVWGEEEGRRSLARLHAKYRNDGTREGDRPRSPKMSRIANDLTSRNTAVGDDRPPGCRGVMMGTWCKFLELATRGGRSSSTAALRSAAFIYDM